LASGRTCTTHSYRARATSSYTVEVGAGEGSTPVRDEEAGFLDRLYHGPVSLLILVMTKNAKSRMIALQLGRPSGIADKDIDIEFPLNIDLQVTDPAHIFEMQNRQIEITKDKYPGAEYTKGYDQVNSVRLFD
jgi:hypothetical protein